MKGRSRDQYAQRLDVRNRADGPFDDRAGVVVEAQACAHGFEGQEYVGKNDSCVEVEPKDRLERDFRGDLRRLAHLDEGVLLAQGAVFSHVAARPGA